MRKQICLLVLLSFVLAGCDFRAAVPGASTATPFIITSTLAPTVVPSATLTPIPATPSPTIVPVLGMTTTQVNVRGKPSSAAPQLATLPAFQNVQIVARDADTNWYEILYPQGPDGKGWVSAQFINITTGKDTIPAVGGSSTSAPPAASTPGTGTNASPSGVIIQQINVRSGPGTSFDAIGTLNAEDTVTIIGKDPTGAWLQINYPAAQGGKGWVAASFVQATGTENVPIVGSSGAAIGTGTPISAPVVLTPAPVAAYDDHDSAQAPAAEVSLSPTGTRSLIYSSDVSVPDGDRQDWIQFTTSVPGVMVALSCTGNTGLVIQLMQAGTSVPGLDGLNCGQARDLLLSAGESYVLQLSAAGGGAALEYVSYTLKMETAP